MLDKGYIHIYTGNGKGKTTAAVGLAVRAACADKKVYIGQFVKSMKYNEVKIMDYIPNIIFEQFGSGCFLVKKPDENDLADAKAGMNKIKEAFEKNYDVVIMDELTIAIYFKLVTVEEVLDLIKLKPEKTELVITGRYAPQELIDIADLVTEMKEIKHYYTKGVLSRNGIDR